MPTCPVGWHQTAMALNILQARVHTMGSEIRTSDSSFREVQVRVHRRPINGMYISEQKHRTQFHADITVRPWDVTARSQAIR